MIMVQKIADLPKERIVPDHPPFTNVGVNYFGPIEVRKGGDAVKHCGGIFTVPVWQVEQSIWKHACMH